MQTLRNGKIRVDVFQRVGGVEAKMARGAGVSLRNRFQHMGRSDTDERLGALLVEQIAAVFDEEGFVVEAEAVQQKQKDVDMQDLLEGGKCNYR